MQLFSLAVNNFFKFFSKKGAFGLRTCEPLFLGAFPQHAFFYANCQMLFSFFFGKIFKIMRIILKKFIIFFNIFLLSFL